MKVNEVSHMDALALLQALPDESVDAIITDPPYAVHEAAWDKAAEYVALALARLAARDEVTQAASAASAGNIRCRCGRGEEGNHDITKTTIADPSRPPAQSG